VRILIAPTAYKGSLSPDQVAQAIKAGVLKARSDARTELTPIADGGDGSLSVLKANLGGELIDVEAQDAIAIDRQTHWLKVGDLAVIELAAICGLGALGENRQSLEASTFGLGQVLRHALNSQPKDILLFLGGSASTDGASGALSALGALFLDGDGNRLKPGGGNLTKLAKVDLSELDKRLHSVLIELAVDVDNPLLGENGAAYIYAPQKGANQNDVLTLEHGLTKFADRLESACTRSLRNLPGTGAAGGTSFGLACALGAKIVSGAERIIQLIELPKKIELADLVITGEGKIDRQSFMGKAIGRVASLSTRLNKPCWVICGAVDQEISLPNLCKPDNLCKIIQAADGYATASDIENTVALHMQGLK
jgi:glycerate 2-kinase